ncbi:hypothetical protein [Endozoicomonas sp. ALC013]|uniref:hypothetical protein n=1 Tax=Endozoicomonas sp. ALC013 TaxID=3403076 RepID=UPI003BB4D396
MTETLTAQGTAPSIKSPTATITQATIDKTAIHQSTTGQTALPPETTVTEGNPGISDSTTAPPTSKAISTAAQTRQSSQTATTIHDTTSQAVTSGSTDGSAASSSITPASTSTTTEQTTTQESITQGKARSTSDTTSQTRTSGISGSTTAASSLTETSTATGTAPSTKSPTATTTQATIDKTAIHQSTTGQTALSSETTATESDPGISDSTTAPPSSKAISTTARTRQSRQTATTIHDTTSQAVTSGSTDRSATSSSMTPASTRTTTEQATTQQSITEKKARSTSDTTSQKITAGISDSTTAASPLTETSTATAPSTKSPTTTTTQATTDKTAIHQSTTGQTVLSSETTATEGDPGISETTAAPPSSKVKSTAAQTRQSSQTTTTIHETTTQTVTSGSTDSSAAYSSMTPASTGKRAEQTTTQQSITQEKARSTSDTISQTRTSGISDSTTAASPPTETSTATGTAPSTKSPTATNTQATIDKTAIRQSTTGQTALPSETATTEGDPGISKTTAAPPSSKAKSTAAQTRQSSQTTTTIHDITTQTVTSGSRDSSATSSSSMTPASTGTAVEKTTTTTTAPDSTPQEKTASISNRTNPTENTTATATTNATSLPKTESDNNQRLRQFIKSFTDKCKTIHSRFNKNMAKIYADTRNKVRQAPATEGQPLDCLEKGILPRGSLHQLNQQFSNKFLNIYKNAHQFMKHLTPAAISEKNHRTAQSIISAKVISEFQTMYATFSNVRLQMLSDLGCSNQQPLDRAAIIRLSSGVYTPPATASVNTDHLLKAIEEQPQSANSDGFDRFLNDLSQILHGKTGQKQQTTPETGNSRPQEKPESTEKVNIDIIDRQHRHHNQQLLIRILQQEQDLFLENIQQPDINPVRKLKGNTAPTPPSHGMTSVQPDPGKTGTPLAIASTPSNNGQTATSAIAPTNYSITDNLTLANMLAAKISDRPIHLNHTMAPGTPGKNASPLDQSPGMQLLTNSLALARQLRTELMALANDLATQDKDVSTQWDQDDLINLAIIQTLPEASAGKATENFLSSVLTSTTLGIQHQKPDNIFRADGSLRGTSQAPGTPLFYDPSTGQTIDHGATRQLASVMLKAMAASRLAEQTTNDDIPQHLSKKIIDQAAQLKNHRPKRWANRLSQLLGLEQGSQASTRASLATRFKQRLSFSKSIKITPPTDMPLVKGLASGRYNQTQSRFMKLASARQLELLKSLASQPDYLGLDHFSAPLARLEADVAVATQTPSPIPVGSDQSSDRQPPDWQTFQLDQRAWQLFTHLYNARFEAPAEAIERIKTAELIQRQGIEPHPDEAQRLNQLVITLLPVRTSASDRAQLINTRGKALPGPVKLHQFNRQRIGEILSSYATIKSQVSKQFPQVFGDRVSDARLKDELVSQIARASLQELKGKTTTGQWQQAVTRQMEREFDDFGSGQAEAS